MAIFCRSDSFITLYFYHLVGNGTIQSWRLQIESCKRATVAFGESGYDSTSLDDLARSLDIRKQSILYHYASKELLLEACVRQAITDLSIALDKAIRKSSHGWDRIESIVKRVFRLANNRPELLGLLREVTRLGLQY